MATISSSFSSTCLVPAVVAAAAAASVISRVPENLLKEFIDISLSL